MNGDINKETGLSQKADMALADLSGGTDGGLLNPEQNDTFIRNLIDQPTLLRLIRTVPMNSPSMEINKIGFGSRILRAGVEATALEANDRSKPTTGKVTLNSKEVIAEIRIPYQVLEDNIERGDLENTLLALIAERAALDLEELIIAGDTDSNDDYIALTDGVLELATSHVVDAAGATVSADIFNSVLKALPTKYRRNKAAMRLISSMDVEQDYRLASSSRGTSLGDAILQGTAALPVFGVPLVGAALMPNANMLFTNPQNIVFGIQRAIRIESERLISERVVKIVLTARVALNIEEEDALVKVINLG